MKNWWNTEHCEGFDGYFANGQHFGALAFVIIVGVFFGIIFALGE